MTQISIPRNYEALDEAFVSKFQKSLIATLSLSSKELFHSNMLAWLIENHDRFAKKFLNVDQHTIVRVEREKDNFDLLVTFHTPGDSQENKVIVENKVKSLPDSAQVQRYKDKNKGHSGFIYLSLMGASDSFQKQHADVRFIDYEKISEWISESGKLQDPYHDALVRDYRDLIDSLLVIKKVAAVPRENRLGFTRTEEESLRKIRMFDVAQKIRYSALAEECTESLKKSGIENIVFPLEVGLTRSVGLISVKLRFYDMATRSQQAPVLLGVQIQGNQYRLFVESETHSDDVMPLTEALLENQLWLNGDNKGKILKFGRNFKYTNHKISDLSINDILDKVNRDIDTLVNNRERIMKLIPLHLKHVR